jgi:RNA polymerase sigma-70 factor (ECF subfamily)
MSLQTHLGEGVELDRQKRFMAAHAACHDRIYRYFRRRTESPSAAEDLCAEVFRIVWEIGRGGGALSHVPLRGRTKRSAQSPQVRCPVG